jgi:hypothetical protein
MNIFLVVLSLIFIICFIVSQSIKYNRFVKINNMNKIYDEMEFYFIKNKITISNNHVELLKRFKNLVVNPDFLDIKFLISIQNAMGKNNNDFKSEIDFFDNTMKTMGNEFIKLFNEFDSNANDIIRLSAFKPDFILFTLKVLILHILQYKFKNPIAKIIQDYKTAINHEESIAYSYQKMKIAY